MSEPFAVGPCASGAHYGLSFRSISGMATCDRLTIPAIPHRLSTWSCGENGSRSSCSAADHEGIGSRRRVPGELPAAGALRPLHARGHDGSETLPVKSGRYRPLFLLSVSWLSFVGTAPITVRERLQIITLASTGRVTTAPAAERIVADGNPWHNDGADPIQTLLLMNVLNTVSAIPPAVDRMIARCDDDVVGNLPPLPIAIHASREWQRSLRCVEFPMEMVFA